MKIDIKRILSLALVACLALGLCACGERAGGADESTAASTAETTQEATEAIDVGKVTYTITVVDEGGNPVANAAVQICKDSCLPGMTNQEGIVEFDVVEDDYKVSFMVMPEGFEADAEEFYFEEGSLELTITLKSVA